jgi:hypothetical protein
MQPQKTNRFTDNIVEKNDADLAIQNYQESKHKITDGTVFSHTDQTNFCSLEIEKLEQYLAYIKREMSRQGVKSQGIKFQFAQYGMIGTESKVNSKYSGKLHIILGAVDLQSLADADNEGIDFPQVSDSMLKIAQLNFMNITPPYGQSGTSSIIPGDTPEHGVGI